MAEGEDLYDDLYENVGDMLLPKAPFQSFHENDIREEEFKKKEAELNAKVELLQKEVEALQQDKAVLTRNISCLFKTAQMELARKDKQMKELRDENLRFKLGGTHAPTNVRSRLNLAVPVGKDSGQGMMPREKIHHNSGTMGTPDTPSSDGSPQFQDRRLHCKSYSVLSTDRVAQGSSSSQLSLGGQTSQSHVVSPKATSEVAIGDTAHEQAVEMDNSKQSISGPASLDSARVSTRLHGPDSDGRRQSSEGRKPKSPSRELLNCSKLRDINPYGTRRTADDCFNNPRSSTNDKDGRSDRPRDGRFDDNMRYVDHGHTKHRSPEWNRDSDRDRSRDRRVDGSFRNLENRKRRRSVSRERDVRLEDREISRSAKSINRNDSESSRERQKDHSSRYHR